MGTSRSPGLASGRQRLQTTAGAHQSAVRGEQPCLCPCHEVQHTFPYQARVKDLHKYSRRCHSVHCQILLAI